MASLWIVTVGISLQCEILRLLDREQNNLNTSLVEINKIAVRKVPYENYDVLRLPCPIILSQLDSTMLQRLFYIIKYREYFMYSFTSIITLYIFTTFKHSIESSLPIIFFY